MSQIANTCKAQVSRKFNFPLVRTFMEEKKVMLASMVFPLALLPHSSLAKRTLQIKLYSYQAKLIGCDTTLCVNSASNCC